MKILKLTLILLISVYSCDKDADVLNKIDINKLKSTWIFHRYVDKITNNSYSLPDGYAAELTFHGQDYICVTGPCNSGLGRYVISYNKITITKLEMTERGCNIIGYENKITNNLSGHYIIKGDTLTIISDFDIDLISIKADSTKTYNCYDF